LKGKHLVFFTLGLAATAVLLMSLKTEPPQPKESPVPPALRHEVPANRNPDPLFPSLESIFNLEKLTVPLDKIRRGPQPKDGIQALTNPDASPAAETTFLESASRVVGVTVDGVSRAYPINVLNWHEVINDHLGNTDLLITYCSLCDGVTVLDRRLDGRAYEFGASGLIYQSNMVLYDRTDQALWSQITSSAISGPHVGRTLRHIDGWELTTLGAWRASHPSSTIVNFKTGQDHPYNSDPHRAYFATDKLDPRYQDVAPDARLMNKTRIIGVKYGAEVRAYPLDAIRAAGQATILDQIGGEPVEITIDKTSGAVRIVHIPEAALVTHTLWFAWAALFPQTEIYQPSTKPPSAP
jgi:Protein of unknown function (DUF3179)